MQNILIDQHGQLICPTCGSTAFSNRRRGAAKLGIATASVLTAGALAVTIAALPKRMQCLGCREYLKSPPLPAPTPTEAGAVVVDPLRGTGLTSLALEKGTTRVVVTASEWDGAAGLTMLKAAYPGQTVGAYTLMRDRIRTGRAVVAELAATDAERLASRLRDNGFSVVLEGEAEPFGGEDRPATTGTTLIDQLERLAMLRDRGALTEEEFTAQKAKLLHDGS